MCVAVVVVVVVVDDDVDRMWSMIWGCGHQSTFSLSSIIVSKTWFIYSYLAAKVLLKKVREYSFVS